MLDHQFIESRLLFLLVVALVVVVIRLVLRRIQIKRFNDNMPTDKKKQELLATISEWKAQGDSYSRRLELLMRQGYRRDVADFILGEAERKRMTE